ncbi:Mariner Mos1 transposase like protein [Argiope bruennichi]|uniref:Mariner Mos1 transposase like protein n=1 Tax=Argiope bruennichi TaxID=94029 RepID=A0A8T0EBY0_ARGBR|nr:Mariner Mos1 transposase like protein [Argiope bruennichi]
MKMTSSSKGKLRVMVCSFPSGNQRIGVTHRCRTKDKQTISARKLMCTVLWDRNGILFFDFLTWCDTVNAERFCATLEKFRRARQKKRLGILSASVVLLHDNHRSHMVNSIKHLFQMFFILEMLSTHPIIPILILHSTDFCLFLYLKKYLSMHHFPTDLTCRQL